MKNLLFFSVLVVVLLFVSGCESNNGVVKENFE